MKKLTRTFFILSILLSTFVFSACGLVGSAKQVIEQTYDQWYVYEGDSSIKIPLGADAEADENSADTSYLNNVDIYLYFSPGDGLTVAIQSETQQNVEVLGGLLSQNVKVYSGGTKKYPKINALGWASIVANIPLETADEPEVSAHPENCLILAGDDAKNFKIQWKKVLARIIYKKFIGEDYLGD